MKLSFYPALLAAAVCLESVAAQNAQNYTVHSTIIFARTGEHTPFLSGSSITLTSYGALQMYNLGAYFRRRYIGSVDNSPINGSPVLTGLSSWRLDNDQVVIQAANAQALVASSQAFMQGLYPPSNLGTVPGSLLDPTSVLARNNDTYLSNPLNGYQYAQVQTSSISDPNLIFVAGEQSCTMNDIAELRYYNGDQFRMTQQASNALYALVGQTMLRSVMLPSAWNFSNAYLIWDYVSYQYNHNSTVRALLNTPAFAGVLDQLQSYASIKQSALKGNLTAYGLTPGDQILAISGKTLAARVLGMMMRNIGTRGVSNKIGVVVGDYEPMLALFSLMNLPALNSGFAMLPPLGSALVFELFSWESGSRVYNGDGLNYPSSSNLYVRFSYRNTTGNGSDTDSLQAYPIFGRGPSEVDMPYSQFLQAMSKIMVADVETWCDVCQSGADFCNAYNTSLFAGGDSGSGSSSSSSGGDSDITPQIAGVIGAAVTLGVLLLLLAGAMLLAGVRIHRNDAAGLLSRGHARKSTASSLGGFKGSAKLASDMDVHIPKNAAPVGVSVVPTAAGPFDSPIDHEGAGARGRGHERVGSWELHEKDDATTNGAGGERFSSLTGSTIGSVAGARVSRRSFDEDDAAVEEEVDRIASLKPTRTDERV